MLLSLDEVKVLQDAREEAERGAVETSPPVACSALEFSSDELLVLMQALRLLENAQRIVAILPARCPKAAGLDALKLANRLNEELLHRHESWKTQNTRPEPERVSDRLRADVGTRKEGNGE
jgi:predicted DNA-binding transcriptional regulator YafY